ncbi:DUF6896 domain-containing protein [Lacipirellula sp.]|uniref:DUF6896 domain-containing protein n=1 Tax=Lacipirellula sp. TaxID=2691419 RepID=UPI003D0C77B4
MPPIIGELHRRLTEIEVQRGADSSSWKRWLAEPIGLTPWESWTLLGLIKHRTRQQFVADTMRNHLQGDEEALAEAGAFGHPEIPQHGVVPGLIEWEYYFHGRGCCLSHRQTGESIDVDFYDETADWFDEFFYTTYLHSLKSPGFVEERLKTLHPGIEAIRLAISQLAERGLIERFPESNAFRLTFDYVPLSDLLQKLEQNWHDPSVQVQLAAAVGDWLLLDELVERVQLEEIAEQKAALIKQRNAELLEHVKSGTKFQADALLALHAVGSPDLTRILAQVLNAKPSSASSAALKVIAQLSDPEWCVPLERLLSRLDPNGPPPNPHLWHAAVTILLRHGRPGKIAKIIPTISSHCLGDLAILTLEYFPELAVSTFRRSLRSEIPCNRITAAAVLAIIDQPWSRSELLAAIRESNDHYQTMECRSALMQTHFPEGRQAVLDWETRNPPPPREGAYRTVDEMALEQSDDTISWEMAKLHDRIYPLRNTLS